MIEKLEKLSDKELLLWYSYYTEKFNWHKEWTVIASQNNQQVESIESEQNAEECLFRMAELSAIIDNRAKSIFEAK